MRTSIQKNATRSMALALAASFMLTTVIPVTSAEAGKRKHWKNHSNLVHVHRHHKKRHRGGGGDALAAGIIGFALGAIIADQATRPRTVYVQPEPVYVQPEPVYVQPQPVYRQPLTDYSRQDSVYSAPIANDYDEPRVIRYEDQVQATYEPWSPEWANWCDNRYRSFNARTGTFRGYDGLDHFCVVK